MDKGITICVKSSTQADDTTLTAPIMALTYIVSLIQLSMS